MRKILEGCPSCGGDVVVTQLSCAECDTVITGHFEPTRFDRLSQENLRFAEMFLRLRGNIKEMERELGVSYPTVRGRLTEVIRELGFESEEEHPEESEPSEDSGTILARLERGEVNVEDAVDQLRRSRRQSG